MQDRPRVWLFGVLLALPLAGLVLLLAVPSIDVMWEHHQSHFLLVLAVALINVALALITSEAAHQHADARLFLVSLALITSSGFLALHALTTPDVLLDHPNSGFAIATPIGLLLASGFAAASAVELSRADAARILRRRTLIRGALALLLIAWAIGSLIGVPFLDRPFEEESTLAFRLLAPVGIGLYAFAAWRYLRIFRVRSRMLPLSVAVAFLLLAEALIAVAFARSWHVSWWEWHVLMAVAFAIVTISVRNEYRREGSITAAFGGLYLEQTLERIDRRSSGAIARLMPAVRSRESPAPILEQLRREGFASDEIVLLEHAAREMARVDELFRPYVGPALANRLELEPSIAELGVREVEVSVLFADLAGFTGFSDGRSPMDVVQMLNAYWANAVPIFTEREGGLIERFAGDAILVVFNALEDQPDHALRAVRAATAMQRAVTETSKDHPDWPRFRIGINSGMAALGNVGVGAHRSFTAIGDTTNVAARLQAAAPAGGILIGRSTFEAVRDEVEAEPFGELDLKGKPAPVPTYEVRVDRTTPP
ncbi:MAG TPA: adenylate/guanylate cyclase domain-containing protein [Actinomycetota bacterium]|nr:adenylate/guanylate cyclase domain-containing protein [Actinomycetota bacterium]